LGIEFGKTGRINRLGSLLKDLTRKEVITAASTFDRLGGHVESYQESNQYDLIIEGKAYPPKAIFGLAASSHLNLNVLSQHFTGGADSPSFRILENLGFEIRPKTTRPGRNEGLVLHRTYSRRDVWRILGAGENFQAGSGTWGLQGIIPDRPLPGDCVLFVTLGMYDGNKYEDAVTEDGGLIWKSQTKHTQESAIIRQLIGHDETRNVVSLFLRTNEKDDYTFLGPLSFKDWDPLSEKPVHIVWQIMEWPISNELINRMGLQLLPPLSPAYQPPKPFKAPKQLTETPPPAPRESTKRKVGPSKSSDVDWAAREAKNRQLGLAGEQLVVQQEISHLSANGRQDLAEKVDHIARVDSAAGYDVLSFDPQTGSEKYIEVKTTTGNINTPFFISANEVEKSQMYGDDYWIYRLYDFSSEHSASFYRLQGGVKNNFDLIPTSFRAERKNYEQDSPKLSMEPDA
jgi:hypothetical protein